MTEIQEFQTEWFRSLDSEYWNLFGVYNLEFGIVERVEQSNLFPRSYSQVGLIH